MKKFFSIIVTMLVASNVWAVFFQQNGIYYRTLENNVEVEVTNGTYKYSGDVVIPSSVTHNGTKYTVTAIGYQAFLYSKDLTSVEIPNTVTSIGVRAFSDCNNLISVTIPNSVTTIEDGAFSGCFKLPSITIPNNVTSIGMSIFERCSNLSSISIPNSITSIPEYAFAACVNLTSVIIPNSVTSIGEMAFCYCSNLESITIPNSVTSIGGGAFFDCTHLSTVRCLSRNPSYISKAHIDEFEDIETGELRRYTYSTFYDNGNSITVYVPCDAVTIYRTAEVWADLNIQCSQGGEIDNKYTITVSQNNNVYGSVMGGGKYAKGATATLTAIPSNGYQFVQWNDGNTENPREITVSTNTTFVASFEKISTSINGVVLENAITISNNQILVNGEAPAFVVTVSGQKIANANLKAGVYFVVVDGNSVSVVVR